MKNYLIISAAALLLLAACAKVTPVETTGKAVAFQVTNSLATTKADYLPGVDGFDTFYTYAIYHSTDPDNPQQWFMDNVAVQATSSTSYEWAPESPYYWPKNGTVSFFCYAGTRPPMVYPTPEDMTKMGFGGGENNTYMCIQGIPELQKDGALSEVDNILVADPAYEYDESAYVPIRFRHMLAKIRFQLVLNNEGSDGTTVWHLIVPSAEIVDKPMLSVWNYGQLVVSYPATTDENPELGVDWTLYKPQSNADAFRLPIYAQTMDLRSDVGQEEEDNLIAVPTDEAGKALCTRECVVIPQPFGDLTFHLEFDFTNSYNETLGLSEHFVIDMPMSKFYAESATSDDLTWKPNHIYTYRITVNTADQITFDPAVENWVENTPGLNI